MCDVAWGYYLFHHLQCPSRVQCSVFCTSILFKTRKSSCVNARGIPPARVAIASPCYSGGGGPSTKNLFPSLNMYQAKSGVKNFSLYWRGGPSTKIFFLVWTCIKPNLVSKIFPLLRLGTPPQSETGYPPPGPGTPLPGPGPGTWAPYLDLRPGPPLEVWTDTQSENITFPILRMRAVKMSAILAGEYRQAVVNKPMTMFVVILDVCTFKIMPLRADLMLVLWCYCPYRALQHFVDFPDVRKTNCSRQAIICFSIRLFGMNVYWRLLHCFLPNVFIVALRQIPLRHREIGWSVLSPTHQSLSLSQVLCVTFI